MRVRVNTPGSLDHRHGKPCCGMHREMECDQVRATHCVERKFFYGEIRAGYLVTIGAQAGGWGSQTEWLPAKLVSGYQEYAHELSGV